MYGRRVGLVADWRRVFAEAASQGKARELELLPFGMAIAALAGIPRERILYYQPIEVVRSWTHRTHG